MRLEELTTADLFLNKNIKGFWAYKGSESFFTLVLTQLVEQLARKLLAHVNAWQEF